MSQGRRLKRKSILNYWHDSGKVMFQEATGICVETTVILGGSVWWNYVGTTLELWCLLKSCHFQGEDLDDKLWLILVDFSSQNSSSRYPLPPPLPQPHGWQLCRCSWGSLHTAFRSQGRHNRPYPTNIRDFSGHCIERILSKITSRFLTRTLENRGSGQVHSKCFKKKKKKKTEKAKSTWEKQLNFTGP